MNLTRAERKRKERELSKKNVKYSLSEMEAFIKKEVTKMQHQIATEARKYAIRDLSAVFIDALYLQHGFAQKRIVRLFKRMNEMFISINKGDVKIQDIIQQVEKDTGIDFTMIYQEDENV